MKKKLLSLALALVMCLGLMVPVSAEVLYDNETFDGDIKFTIDSNGTLSLTGTGELDLKSFFGLGQEFIALMIENGYLEADTVTINIASGITIADKDVLEEVCTNLKLFAANSYGFTIKTVNINHSSAPAPTPAPTPAPAPTPTPTPTASKFTDVAANSPYKDAIDWAVEKNITKGTTDTTFGPNQTCTVSHILTFILRCTGEDPSREEISQFCEELSQELNIPNLKPDQPCTRALAVQFLYLLYGGGGNQSAAFSDVPSDSGPLSEAVNWAVESGVTKGTSVTTFSPNNICTRGQIVTFLYRADKAK